MLKLTSHYAIIGEPTLKRRVSYSVLLFPKPVMSYMTPIIQAPRRSAHGRVKSRAKPKPMNPKQDPFPSTASDVWAQCVNLNRWVWDSRLIPEGRPFSWGKTCGRHLLLERYSLQSLVLVIIHCHTITPLTPRHNLSSGRTYLPREFCSPVSHPFPNPDPISKYDITIIIAIMYSGLQPKAAPVTYLDG